MRSYRVAGRRAAAAALAVACLGSVGCSVSVERGGADLSEVEDMLVEEQEKKSPNLAVGGATCPDDVEVEEGKSFECIVEIEGVDAPYTVTLTEEDPGGESGNFHMKPAKPIIDVSIVVDFVRSRLNQASAGAEVDCGDAAVIVTEVGGTFDCTVSDERGSETATMVVKNVEGDVSFK